jgi:hypothetical protein
MQHSDNMHSVSLYTKQDLHSLLGSALEQQDALTCDISKDSKPDMTIHEAMDESDLSSNTCDTNLVDNTTHTHTSNG